MKSKAPVPIAFKNGLANATMVGVPENVLAVKSDAKCQQFRAFLKNNWHPLRALFWAQNRLSLYYGATLASNFSSNLWRHLLIKITTFQTLNSGVRHLPPAFN